MYTNIIHQRNSGYVYSQREFQKLIGDFKKEVIEQANPYLFAIERAMHDANLTTALIEMFERDTRHNLDINMMIGHLEINRGLSNNLDRLCLHLKEIHKTRQIALSSKPSFQQGPLRARKMRLFPIEEEISNYQDLASNLRSLATICTSLTFVYETFVEEVAKNDLLEEDLITDLKRTRNSDEHPQISFFTDRLILLALPPGETKPFEDLLVRLNKERLLSMSHFEELSRIFREKNFPSRKLALDQLMQKIFRA
ncbi:MAG: hypothetical protein FJZ56_00025 [Chlamydiae bacterium]|nr:hypothetical protein [Chlamydiota bacterium]